MTKRYYEQGVEIVGDDDYYYTKDHLGSIREVTNSSETVVARYDYDPFGRRTKLTGSFDSDFGYTGHFTYDYNTSDSVPELVLAPYRAYDPETARWLSRDPIEEEGGLNLYVYVHNTPVNTSDPSRRHRLIPCKSCGLTHSTWSKCAIL